MSNTERYWAVVPAAGTGQRMCSDLPKQYLPINNQPLISYTLRVLLAHPRIEQVVVALAAEDEYWVQAGIHHEKLMTVAGGDERSDSVFSALNTLSDTADGDDWVLVHDAARPCLDSNDIDRLITSIGDDWVGGLLAMPATDTVKLGDGARVIKTQDRNSVWMAQTPQMFRFGLLYQALHTAREEGHPITDEASAIEGLGLHPKLVMGAEDNIKVTRPRDLELAQLILSGNGLSGNDKG